MIEKLRQEAMRQGMKLMSNPKFTKFMADHPRLMNAVSQGFTLKGRVQSGIESKIRSVASLLNIATKEDVEHLRQTVTQLQNTVTSIEKKVG